MVFGFFKRRSDKEIEDLRDVMQNSFRNMHEDMGKVTTWINHFHGKHNDHDQNFKGVSKRLDKVEFALAELQAVILNSSQQEKNPEVVIPEDLRDEDSEEASSWMELTETQQKLCWKIAALQKEMPNEWISLKTLAQEMYPERNTLQCGRLSVSL